MKVLLLATEIEDYTIAYANGLSHHAEVVLAVPRRRFAALARWVDPAVDLRLMDWPRHRSPANLRLLLALDRIVRRERPAVIHLLSHNTLWLNLALPFWRGTPIVTTVHDVAVHPGDAETARLPTAVTDLAARQSDTLIVHGPSLRQAAMRRFGRPAERVQVLSHPAIDRYARRARELGLGQGGGQGAAGDRFTLLLFGRIYAYKGLEALIRAEAALAGRIPGLRVVIAGRGTDARQMSPLMGDPTRYDIRNRFIPDDEVAELFAAADAVVLPYSEGSQSGVLNVAAAFGLPVVATDVGELGATVAGRGLGLVVPPRDPDALAGAILRLATEPALRARAGAAARDWADGANAPAAVGARAAAIYREVIARHAARRAPRPVAGLGRSG